ncbi:MAG TPA: DUF488 domain-containing protein [Kofleriaceae bacterium]|nr:DUF488 domain-containing protein [Kofleriaceae bacterium]
MTIFTIGHSTRPIEDFIALLRAHGVKRLVDIRTIPRSRANPQYGRGALGRALRNRRIAYTYRKELGGLRRAAKDSPNAAWRNPSFRGYADYMQTPEFEHALDDLLELDGPIAIMCAEAVPWRCHRSLVADALVAREVPVAHIMSATRANPHELTSFAKVRRRRVTYPAAAAPPGPASAPAPRRSRARR